MEYRDSGVSHYIPRETLDDALAKTGFGKFNYLLICLCGAILGCVFLETVGINFILPVAQCDLELENLDKAVLSAIGFVGMIFSSHLWGFLADTRGRKTVMVPTLFIAFAITIVSSFATSFWFMVLLRFLNGFFISGPSATVYAFLGEFHSVHRRSQVLMMGSVIFGTFCLLNPTFAYLIINQDWRLHIDFLNIDYVPWRLFMVICGLPNIFCGLALMLFIPESPKFTFAQGDEMKTLLILRQIYGANTGEPKDSFTVICIINDRDNDESRNMQSKGFFHFMWSQTAPLFQKPHLRNTLTACFIQFCIFNCSNGLWTFFPDIMNKVQMWNDRDQPSHSATICEILDEFKHSNFNSTTVSADSCNIKLEFSAFINAFLMLWLYIIGWIIISFVINFTGKLAIILITLFTCGASAFALTVVTNPILSSFLYIVVLAVGIAITVVNASTIELYPTRLRAMAVCISLMMGRLGSVVGSNVIGLILDNHCKYTFLIPTILLITSGILACTIPNITKRQK